MRKPLTKTLSYLDAPELQDLEKISEIWFMNLNSIVNKIKNRESSMIVMRPKDAIKLEIVKLYKPEIYPEEEVLPEDGLCIYLYRSFEQRGNQHHIYKIYKRK